MITKYRKNTRSIKKNKSNQYYWAARAKNMSKMSWELEESNRCHSKPQGMMKGRIMPCLAEQGAVRRRLGEGNPLASDIRCKGGGAMGNHMNSNRENAQPALLHLQRVRPCCRRNGWEGQDTKCTTRHGSGGQRGWAGTVG